ncbi:MAG TPA: hypothetical protein VFS10_18315 [Pyrinomonadaceae bacterium]|nr:hypothetical protein [Pyrinomonadaceae bacterium]
MSKLERRSAVFLFTLVCWCAGLQTAAAQEQQQPEDAQARPAAAAPARRDDTNHDVHLYMLVGTNDGAAQRGALTQFLEGVSRRLRSSLPFAGYRLALTLIYRVRDGGSLEVRGISGAPLTGIPAGDAEKLDLLRVQDSEAEGRQDFRGPALRRGARLPLRHAYPRRHRDSPRQQQ